MICSVTIVIVLSQVELFFMKACTWKERTNELVSENIRSKTVMRWRNKNIYYTTKCLGEAKMFWLNHVKIKWILIVFFENKYACHSIDLNAFWRFPFVYIESISQSLVHFFNPKCVWLRCPNAHFLKNVSFPNQIYDHSVNSVNVLKTGYDKFLNKKSTE